MRPKDGDTGYNYIVEADELEKILGLSCYDEDREREAWRGVWSLAVTGMGDGAIMPVESIVTLGIGHL